VGTVPKISMTHGVPHGYDPVARFEEMNGDIYHMADDIAGALGDDYAVVNVVHGEIYLCEVVDDEDDDPYWLLHAEVREGKTGSWDSASDKAANTFPEPYLMIDEMDGKGRYIVFVNE